MNFNSIEFLVFYPIVVLLNYITPTRYRYVPLLLASLYFYISQGGWSVLLILTTTVISYFSGVFMEKYPKKKKWWLAISVISSLAILFFFKYYNLLARTASGIVGFDLTLSLLLPIGISFYTFQTLSYSIDVYRGSIAVEHHFGYYALFVTFFPQLVAGPIERPDNLIPQLKAEHKWDREAFSSGAKRMLAGFFKKIVVADLTAQYVDRVFGSPNEVSGSAVVVAAMLFAVQIYCDFSGYTDIAIGCARIMGYRLMQNFNRPYSARNIKDFWARWHISLTSWFKDYVYIPLGGNRRGFARMLVNLSVVFIISGLWHGAEWTFLLWGALHAIYRLVGILTAKARENIYQKLGVSPENGAVIWGQRITTFLLVSFAWIFFRANNTHDLMILLSKVFGEFNLLKLLPDLQLTITGALILVLSYAVMMLLDRRYTLPEKSLPSGGAKLTAGTALYLLWAVIFAWFILKASGGSGAFIYFRF